jgi:hypothetical protein
VGASPRRRFANDQEPRSGDIMLSATPMSPLRGFMRLSLTVPWVAPTAKRRGHYVANDNR